MVSHTAEHGIQTQHQGASCPQHSNLISLPLNPLECAKFHSFTFRTIRHDTNGVPLQPAMMAKERRNVTPGAGLRCRQVERLRFDTAGFAQSDNEVPSFFATAFSIFL